MNLNQNPLEEVQERLAESSPTAVLGRVIAAEDMRHSLAAYRRRVDEANAMGLAALGFGGQADQLFNATSQRASGETMGGISISGDTHQYFGGMPAVQTQPQPAPVAAPVAAATPAPPAATQSSLGKYLWPAITAAALSGPGGYVLYDYFFNQEPAPVTTPVFNPDDWKLEVDVIDRQ